MQNMQRLGTGIGNFLKYMGIREGRKDRFLIVTDTQNRPLIDTIARIACPLCESVRVIEMEHYGRPITEFKDPIKSSISGDKPTVTLYIGTPQKGELPFRQGMRRYVIDELNGRHGFLPSSDPTQIMLTGMQIDPDSIRELTARVHEAVKNAHIIRVTTARGTDMIYEFDHTSKEIIWVPTDGFVEKPKDSTNPIGGEVFTTPVNANGILIVDGGLGGPVELFGEAYKILNDTPLSVTTKDGYCVEMGPKDHPFARMLFEHLQRYKNGLRVGEVGLPTNIYLTELIGDMVQDEKGLFHEASGHSLREYTFVDPKSEKAWKSDEHVDKLVRAANIDVDGRYIMRNGLYVLDK